MSVFFQILIAVAGLSSFMPAGKQMDDGNYLSPTHIYCDKQSGRAYISLSTSAKIAVVNTTNNLFESYINLPFNPGGIALSSDSKTLIVADNRPEGRVHFISLPEGELIRSIKVGHSPDALAITPDGRQVFVANRFSNTVSLIDVAKKK
jgi:DNA-binding beta-propeller fold protein YncE